jgi:hypothetical protein
MHIKTLRLPVVLVLVAASLLLTVPGVAGAHVRAKYRADYKSRLTLLNMGFVAFARNYDNVKQGSVDTAETMAPMIGDPDQREQLVAHENWCLDIYNRFHGKPVTWLVPYWKTVDAFTSKAQRYFATATQRSKFKHACGRLRASSGMLILSANDHLYESYRQLSFDPPHINLSAQAIAAGDEDAAYGHEGFDKWLAALRALL